MDIRCPCDSNLRQIPITVQLSVKTRGTQSQAKPPPNFFGVRTSKKSVPLRIKMLIPSIIPTKKTMAAVLVTANCYSISAKALLCPVLLRMHSGKITFARKKSEQSLKCMHQPRQKERQERWVRKLDSMCAHSTRAESQTK